MNRSPPVNTMASVIVITSSMPNPTPMAIQASIGRLYSALYIVLKT